MKLTRLIKAYRLNGTNFIVTDKNNVKNAFNNIKESDFEEVTLIISADEIMMMNDEIELIGMSEYECESE